MFTNDLFFGRMKRESRQLSDFGLSRLPFRRSTGLWLLLLLGIGGGALFFRHLQASIYGVPPGYTGGPWDGITCATAGCHRGPVTTVSGWISTDVPSSGYLPGDTYLVTLTATRPQTTLFGFQVTAQSADGIQGRFLITDPVQTQFSLNDGYVTHKIAGSSGINQKTWSMKWVAPDPPPSDGITLYAAFVAGIFDQDDEVFLSTRPLFVNPGVSEITSGPIPPDIYPNPFFGVLNVKWPYNHVPVRYMALYTLQGKRLCFVQDSPESGFSSWQLTTGDLPNGTYLLEIRSDHHQHWQKVICRRP